MERHLERRGGNAKEWNNRFVGGKFASEWMEKT
jgi:hypothetical protein